MLLEKLPWPPIGDAEALADRAVRSVGRDHVLRAHRVARPRRLAVPIVAVTPSSASCRARRPPTRIGCSAPSSSRLRRRIGSRPICVMNSRGDGLRSSTPSLISRKYQSSSFPPRLSTETIAPFWTNSRRRRFLDCVLEADRAVESPSCAGRRARRADGWPVRDAARRPGTARRRAARNTAADSPTRLPPTIRTGVSTVFIRVAGGVQARTIRRPAARRCRRGAGRRRLPRSMRLRPSTRSPRTRPRRRRPPSTRT